MTELRGDDIKAKKIALYGITGALAIAVSILEGLFAVPFLPPGAKPGLSNVVTMTMAVISGFQGGIYITLIKSLFTLIFRGFSAFLFSFCAGMVSSVIVILLIKMPKCPFSIIGISIIGALLHNIIQIIVACFLTGTNAIVYYLPVMLIAAVPSGLLTGVIIKTLQPFIKNLSGRMSNEQ